MPIARYHRSEVEDPASTTRPASAIYSFLLLCLFCLASAGSSLIAQQFSLAQWKHKDGLPSTDIHAITQTPDGFLWLGTADGLVRYDGFQFVQIAMQQFGMRPLGQINILQVSQDGALFAGTASGVVLRLKGQVALVTAVGAPVIEITNSPRDEITIKTTRTLVHLMPETLTVKTSEPLPQRSSLDKALLMTSKDAANALQAALAGALLRQTIPKVRKILDDHSGDLWLATADQGVMLLRNGHLVERFNRMTGLTSDRIWDIYEDRERNIWVGTKDGLNRLRPDKLVTLTEADSLRTAAIRDLAPGPNSSLWIGSGLELDHFGVRNNSLRVHTLTRGDVTALLPLDNGKLIFVSDGRLHLLSQSGMPHLLSGSSISRTSLMARSGDGLLWSYSSEDGLQRFTQPWSHQRVQLPLLAGQTVTAMAAGSGSELWFALEGGRLLRYEDHNEREFRSEDGAPEGVVGFLSPQADGTLWIATDQGLSFYDGHRFLHWSSSSGLPGNRVLWAIPDMVGHLWLGYSFGVDEITLRSLTEQASGRVAHVDAKFYDDGDGLEGNPVVRGATPVARTSDGKIWFTMSEGVAMIDPAHITRNLLPPPVHILQLTADGTDLPLDGIVSLKPLTRTLSFYYAGLSLSEPRKVQYRYRLEGFDTSNVGWQDAAGSHTATYTNLRPGSYRFRVLASNNDGVWNESGASLNFQIRPAYYQTGWFKTPCGIVGLLLSLLFYQRRLERKASILQLGYDARLAERNRIAQEMHDNLIQQMIGISLQLEIADEVTPANVPAKKFVNRALGLTQNVIGNGRAALHSLRQQPITLAELRKSLEDTSKASRGDANVPLRFVSFGQERSIAADIGDDVLQITREAVRNALRHAASSEISIMAEFRLDQLSLIVTDQGPGISIGGVEGDTPGHYGIRGMHERAARIGATLDLKTSSGSGTEWRLTIPGNIAYQGGLYQAKRSLRESIRSYRTRPKRDR